MKPCLLVSALTRRQGFFFGGTTFCKPSQNNGLGKNFQILENLGGLWTRLTVYQLSANETLKERKVL